MNSIPIRKQDMLSVVTPPVAAPPHPAAPALAASAARVAAREAPTGYRRAQAPEWLITGLGWLVGLAIFVAAWSAIAKFGGRIPGPEAVWVAAVKIFSDPFYVKGPNDQGIGWN